MSQQNVEIVRRSIEAWNLRDWDRAAKLLDPDVELHGTIDGYQRGKSSGVELLVDTASVLDLRDGRIVRMQGFMDRAEALKAAGLGE